MTTATPARPEPVLEAATLAGRISSLVSAVGFCFVIAGWASPQQVQTWAVATGGVVTALGAVLAYLLPVILAKGARAQVTPLESPQTVDGTPLAPSAAAGGLAALRQSIAADLAALDSTDTVAPASPAAAPADAGLSIDGAVPQPDDPTVAVAAAPGTQVSA